MAAGNSLDVGSGGVSGRLRNWTLPLAIITYLAAVSSDYSTSMKFGSSYDTSRRVATLPSGSMPSEMN